VASHRSAGGKSSKRLVASCRSAVASCRSAVASHRRARRKLSKAQGEWMRAFCLL